MLDIITEYELIVYELKEILNHIVFLNLNTFSVQSLIMIFISGCIAGCNPCNLSILPFSLNYINLQKSFNKRTLLFMSGTLTSIVILGIISLFIQKKSLNATNNFHFIISIITCLIGLNLLRYFKHIRWNIIFDPELFNSIFINQDYLLGFSVGINTSACSTPILLSITLWITSTQNLTQGIYYIMLYAIGYSIPILIAITSLYKINKIILTTTKWDDINYLMGCILLSIGSYSLTEEILLLL